MLKNGEESSDGTAAKVRRAEEGEWEEEKEEETKEEEEGCIGGSRCHGPREPRATQFTFSYAKLIANAVAEHRRSSSDAVAQP